MYLALKLKFVEGCGYETYNTKEVKKRAQRRGKSVWGRDGWGGRKAAIPLVTHVNNVLQSIFSNAEVYINNQQIYNSNALHAHKS